MIEYFRLHIEYLWNAVDLKKTEHSDSLNIQFSIVNSQFRFVRVNVPDTGRRQPVSGYRLSVAFYGCLSSLEFVSVFRTCRYKPGFFRNIPPEICQRIARIGLGKALFSGIIQKIGDTLHDTIVTG